MKKIIGILLLFFSFNIIFAQKFSLQWNGSESVDYGTEKKSFPKFSNEGYSVENGIVFINISQLSQGKRFKIENLKWKQVSEKELYDAAYFSIPDVEIQDISYYIEPNKQQEYYNAKVATLKKIDNQYFRLESFEISVDNSTQRYSKALTVGTSDNPLKSGTFYKIKIDKSGVYKINKKFLSDNGINVSNITPKNIRIYGNGGIMLPEDNRDERYAALQQNAIQVVGEDDGTFDDDDYILFYAQGPDGFNLYSKSGLTNSRRETRTDTSRHLKNIYEDYSYYFLNFDIGEGKRIQEENITSSATATFTKFDDYQFVNNDKYNLLGLGRVWVDEGFTSDTSVTFSLPSSIESSDVAYRVSVVGYSSQGNSISFNINGQNSVEYNISSSASDFVKYTKDGTVNLSGNSIVFNFIPNISTNPNGQFYMDYVEIQYKQNLTYNDSQMNFRSYSIEENSGNTYRFSVSNTTNAEQIWNVSDITNVKKEINQSGSSSEFNFAYTANSVFNNEFVVFKNSAAYTPTFVGRINNQDLSALKNVDYLIITSSEMLAQGQRIANYYTNKYSYHTEVVDVEKIYNEFSSGSKDITAIRDFITKLNNENGGLKYVLIIGDTSYDYKNLTSGNDNIVPGYQSEDSSSFESSFVTDDYFVMTKDQTSSYMYNNLPDIPIGRLPASNVTEAKLLVDKTLAYYNGTSGQSTPFGVWRMKLDFVADDDYDGGSPFHNIMETSIKNNFEGTERNEYNVKKLYLDAYTAETSSGGQRYPDVNTAISNDFGNSLYMFYLGHGGINGWAQERVLTTDEINSFNNYNSVYSRFPLVSTITCEFTLWDNPAVSSAGEQLLKLSSGGAATMITSSRAIAVSYGIDFTGIFTQKIFELTSDNQFNSLGDAYLAAKEEKGINSNHFRVNFLGDPAMILSRPSQQITIDEISTPVDGQLRALDFVKITGRVTNASGNTDETFNGKAVVNIYDKRINKETLNNDNASGMTPVLEYTEEGSAIVKASGTVEKGQFAIQFYVPKDINYEVGTGRMLVYADNFSDAGTSARDVYNNQTIKVGGINPDGIDDTTPPNAYLYMNNTNFADGGITDQNPTFLACLTDDTGINSTGAGVGHDITVYLDGEIVNTITLNDYYSSGEGSGCTNADFEEYQKGYVMYPFKDLEVGEHQLTFKVWDINNNSTTATLNFVVKDESDGKLVINRLLNWPNPFTNKTYIQFEHNCDDILDVNVQIYTITGRLVKTISTSITAEPYMEGYRTPRQAIEWDGKDDYGDTVAKGTYIFKVYAKSQNQDKCSGGASAVEKMVMLK